jgi:hypothetical protein
MSWGIIAMGGSALLGGINANDQQQAQTKQNKAAAEHNRYSNWTGRTMQQRFDAPSTFGGAISGGLAGFGAAQGAGAFGGAAPTPGASSFVSDNMSQPSLYSSPYKKLMTA